MIQILVSLLVMFGVLQVCAIFFHLFEFLCTCVFFIDTDIIWVTRADVGEVGCLVARLVGHNPLPRPPGGRGGGSVGEPGEVASRPSGDGIGPSNEGSNMGVAKVAAKRARVDAAKARIATLTTQVEALEDFQG